MAGAIDHKSDYEIVGRIIATLLAMAVLAERLYFLPRSTRHSVMYALRPAEAAVRNYVGANAWSLAAPMLGRSDGYDPEDALRLACSLRSLAAALGCMLVYYEYSIRSHAPCEPAGHLAAARSEMPRLVAFGRTGAAVLPAVPLIDTS